MSCSSGSCTCGFVYKNKVRNSQASPSPQLLPATPLQAGDLLQGGGEESVLVVLWGTGSARKMEGGVIAPPGPRRRKLQLEQLAREPLACLWVFSFCFFFFFPFPFPFHHLFAQPVPAAPVTLILPALPHPLQLGAAWGRLDPRRQLLGREEGARHRYGRDWVPRWSRLRGS